MVQELSVPKAFGPAQASAWFTAWSRVAKEPELTLVLAAGCALRATGLVLLASGIAERQRGGLRTSLKAASPSDAAIRDLQRIEFFSALGVHTEAALARPDPGVESVPLRPIADERAARELANISVDRLHLGSTSPLRMARFVFEELGVNIVQHSGAADTGFGVLQSYPQDQRLEIAFADRGIGFLASLQKNPEFEGRVEDEGEALQIALGKGATGTSEPRRNMGMGLGLLQDFSDRLGGELWISSGTATLRRRSVAGVRTTTVHANEAWRGSWVCLDAPLKA